MTEKEAKNVRKSKKGNSEMSDAKPKKKKDDISEISEGGGKKVKKSKRENSEMSDAKPRKKKDDNSEISENDGRKSRKSKKDNSEISDGKPKKKKRTKSEISTGKESIKKKQKSIIRFDSEDSEMSLSFKMPEIDRLRKSHYVREEKLTKLRKENAPADIVYQEMFAEDFDDKIEELQDEIGKLKKTIQKQKDPKKTKLPPDAQLQIQNDWLEVHIREWNFKIESLESKFELVKRAHKNAVDALAKAHVLATDQVEMEEMREALRNKKNDLYEAVQLIQELQKVAWTMLPIKVAKNCEMVEDKMLSARTRLDELMYEMYRMKMETVSHKKELTALTMAISGEEELANIVSKKIDRQREDLNKITATKLAFDAIIVNGNNLLEMAGITYEEACARVAFTGQEKIPDLPLDPRLSKDVKEVKAVKPVKEAKPKKKVVKKLSNSDTETKSIIDGGQRKSIVAMDEKMTFLVDKRKQLEADIAATRTEIEKSNNEQKLVLGEMKKIMDIKVEIEKLNKSKTTIGLQLQQEVVLRKTYYNQIEDLKGKIRVFSRCRPISKAELDRGNVQCVAFPDKYTVAVFGVSKDGKAKEFQFDRVFPPETEQDDVFEDTSRLIQSAFDGFNVCIFAYGQTGSGKTHTLIGNLQHAPGIAPRSFVRLFEVVAEGKSKFTAKLNCYMLELYNEKLLDLMASNAEYSDKLDIKKDQHGMVIVPGAELLPAASGDELRDLFLKGNGNRHIASTKMNSESSRSHLIISIMIECTMLANGKIVRGKMSIIDLAGSERSAKSGVKGVGATEATAINMSLSALGDVISALTSGQPFIPYRNNKLTMLMQDSLGGNAKTLMFVNLSPVDYNATETCNSLVYAQRVKLIKNDAIKVADTEEIPKLQGIIDRLVAGEKIEDFITVAA